MKMSLRKNASRDICQNALRAFILTSIFALGMPSLTLAKRSIEDELKLKAGDEVGNELKAAKTEVLVMKSEKKALAQLEKLRVRHKGTRMLPEILFRMAELHMRRARTERFFEIHKDSEQVTRFAPQLVQNASEVKEIKKAIDALFEIERDFPRFRSIDTVLFNSGYAYQQIGNDVRAEEQYQKLLSRHRNSPLVPDTLLAVGEIHYNKRKFSTALDFFNQMENYPQARVYPYGLYKAAWCRYNMQDAAGGLKLLERVVRYGHSQAEQKQAQRLDLRKEALGDAAIYFSETRPSSEAVAYFKALSDPLDSTPYLLKLTELYKRHSKYADVDLVLKGILQSLPKTDSTVLVHEELIWNADRVKNRKGSVDYLTGLEAHCAQRASELDADRCRQKALMASKKLGARLHAYHKRERSVETAPLALKAYEAHLRNLDPKRTQVAEDEIQVRTAYSDLLFGIGRFRDSSVAYSELSDLMAKLPASPISIQAAYGAVLGLERAVEKEKSDRWSDADETRFDELAKIYLSRAPRGEHAIDVRFKRAFIAYEKEKFESALALFRDLGWDSAAGSHPKKLKAQDLYLDILNIQKNYAELRAASEKLLASGGLSSEREDRLKKIQREAWFASLGESDRTQPQKSHIEEYLGFARAPINRGTSLAFEAWWNASQIAFREKQALKGAELCVDLQKQVEKVSPQQQLRSIQCLKQAIETFEAMARLKQASDVAGLLAKLDQAQQKKWAMLAFDFKALSGDRELKSNALSSLLGQAQHRPDEVARLLQLASELGEKKWIEQARSIGARYSIEPETSESLLLEAEQLYESGKYTDAFSVAKKIIGREDALKEHKWILGKARMIQAEILFREYRSQSVKARADKLGVVLALKTEKLEKAQKAFQSAARMGDAVVAVQSLARLSDLYSDYGSALKSMPLPKDIPESDQKALRSEIENLILPMEEKGVEALAQAIELNRKSQAFSGLAARMQLRMNQLNLVREPSSALRDQLEMKVAIPKRVVPVPQTQLFGGPR